MKTLDPIYTDASFPGIKARLEEIFCWLNKGNVVINEKPGLQYTLFGNQLRVREDKPNGQTSWALAHGAFLLTSTILVTLKEADERNLSAPKTVEIELSRLEALEKEIKELKKQCR